MEDALSQHIKIKQLKYEVTIWDFNLGKIDVFRECINSSPLARRPLEIARFFSW